MEIINVDLKSATNGNTYKSVTLADKIYSKDRTNVFSNHPLYGQLVPGYNIPNDQLEINQKGYLELKGGITKKSSAPVAGDNEMLRRTHDYVVANNALLNKLVKHFELDEKPKIGNTGIDYPTEPNPDDVPFN